MSGLPILAYHALDDSGSAIATDPARFARAIAAMAASGYRAVDLGDWIAAGRPAVERGFALTFDDGLRSVRRAADVLARHGFTATAFLVAGRMGGDNAWPGQPRGIPRSAILNWSEVEELAAAGFRFGAHSRSHRRLDLLPEGELEGELRGARDEIEGRLGTPCRLLAYPYGRSSPRVRAAAASWFDGGLGTRLDEATPRDPPFDLPRIDAYYLRSDRALRALVEGRLMEVLKWRRIARRARELGQVGWGSIREGRSGDLRGGAWRSVGAGLGAR